MDRDPKYKSGPLFNLRPYLLVFLLILTTPRPVLGDEGSEGEEPNNGLIEVHYAPNFIDAYRDRRGPWSFQVSANMENFYPDKFLSLADGLGYKDLFGSTTVPLTQLQLGAKYNFVLGALTGNVVGGLGTVTSSRSGTARELSILKKAVAVEWILDAVMKEPYVAPYIQGQYLDFSYSDRGSPSGNNSGTTAWTTGYTIGLLIQLNFIDQTNAADVANFTYGLNNTFIDIFATEYNTSNAADDPQLRTSFNWGAGLRLEF